MVFMGIFACAAPELPDTGSVKSAPVVEAFCEGAQIGSVEMQIKVRACTANKRYYDRAANEGAGMCTDKRIAPFGCTEEGLYSVLNSKAKADLEFQKNNRLKNYRLDQCFEDVSKENLPVYKCIFEDGTNTPQVIDLNRI